MYELLYYKKRSFWYLLASLSPLLSLLLDLLYSVDVSKLANAGQFIVALLVGRLLLLLVVALEPAQEIW